MVKEPNFPEEYDYNDLLDPEDIPFEDNTQDPSAENVVVYPDDSIMEAIFTAEDLASGALFSEDPTDPDPAEEMAFDEQVMYDSGLQPAENAQLPLDEDFSYEEILSEEAPDAQLSEPVEETAIDPEESQPDARPVRKGRPKPKDGPGLLGIPHILSALIWLMIIVAIGTTLGRMLWVCAADVLAFGREDKVVTISVTTSDTMESIAQKLSDAGLVRYPKLFLLYADLTDAEEDITTGTFSLNTIYDYHALVSQMSPRSGARAVVEDVLIPEGYNCRQIFALLEEKGICKVADLEAWAASGELSEYWFLEGVERGDKYCLEGFLFPDTYDFYENSTPKAALEKMLDGFEYRVNEEVRNKIPALNERLTEMMRKNGSSEEFIAANQFDIRDVVNVASLIEKETATNQESYKIASVIYNRLFSWGSTPRYLNIDATLIYALGGKSDLTAADKAVDSPYNTYMYTGMTPGPIANPGLASIEAALDPEDTSYYYYVLDPQNGVHDFSKTLAEHDKKVDKYYGG